MSVALMTLAFKADIPPTQKFVLVALCDSANDQGECYPSVAALATKCSLGERTVQEAINYLERAGALRREFRTGRSTTYWMTPDRAQPPQQPHPRSSRTPQQPHPTPADCAPPPPQQPHPTPAAAAPITVKEPSLEPSRNRKSADVAALTAQDLVADGVSEEVATEFLALRKRKRAPLTPLAWAGMRREAEKAGWSLVDAVLKCVERNWQAFDAAFVADARAGPKSFAAERDEIATAKANAWMGSLAPDRRENTLKSLDEFDATRLPLS